MSQPPYLMEAYLYAQAALIARDAEIFKLKQQIERLKKIAKHTSHC